MSSDYAPAQWLGNNQIGYGGWPVTNRRWIIVHGTAGDRTIEAVQQTFMANFNKGEPSSTHYAVGEDGRVGQYVPENAVAWGNGPITGPAGIAIAGIGNAHDAWWDNANTFHNANPSTLSIEHCKSDTANAGALTPQQEQASFALIKHLCDVWHIPRAVYSINSYATLANGGITGHFSMDPVNRAFCPGTYPWKALQTFLDGIQNPMLDISQVSQWYTLNPDGSWQRTGTGIQLHGGILDYYRRLAYPGGSLYGMSLLGLPLTNELPAGSPKPGSTAQPTRQLFERGLLAYDPDRVLDNPPGSIGPIYAAHVQAVIQVQ